MIDHITIKAKLKKDFSQISELLSGLGFSKIKYEENRLIIEKSSGEDLHGNPFLDYRIIFNPDSINIEYELGSEDHRNKRIAEILPVLLNLAILLNKHYQFDSKDLLKLSKQTIESLLEAVDKDSLELSAELTTLKDKYADLNKKYMDLVRSSEENSQLLIECERKRDELKAYLEQMQSMSDDLLREELFKWIKIHNGTIDIEEFATAYNIHPMRVEDGLNMLIKDGYIRRKQ